MFSILNSSKFLIHFFLINQIICTWYFKEAKICDPSGTQLLPFTGFKIYKQFTVDGLLPPILSYTSLSHCDHGVKDFEKLSVTSLYEGIDWTKPFCMVKPRNRLFSNQSLHLSDEVGQDDGSSIDLDTSPSNVTSFADATSVKKSKKLIEKFVNYFVELKHKFVRDIDSTLENATSGGFIQYSGRQTTQRKDDSKLLNPQDVAVFDSADLRCFKLARRKKYARRQQPYYIPYTWVGGLFECHIRKDIKESIIKNMNSASLVSDYEFECSDDTAVPIAPLVADDLSIQWIEKRFSLNPSITQFIPQFKTAGPLDLRFSIADTSDISLEDWASEINVNENYTYTALDIDLINSAAKRSKSYLEERLNLYANESPFTINNIDTSSDEQKMIFNDYFEMMKNVKDVLTSEQKHLSVLANLPQKTARRHLKKIQQIWDEVNLTPTKNFIHAKSDKIDFIE